MMGALTIFSQAPIRVGDFVCYGAEMGIVEDIGLRTTRLRTLTNTVVSIPNSRIASLEVENLSYRTKIRYWPTLRLRYDTSPEQLMEIVHSAGTSFALPGRSIFPEGEVNPVRI
jgi:MscS family membrane protein